MKIIVHYTIKYIKMETPPFNHEPTRMVTRSVLAEIPTRLGRLSMTDPNNGYL